MKPQWRGMAHTNGLLYGVVIDDIHQIVAVQKHVITSKPSPTPFKYAYNCINGPGGGAQYTPTDYYMEWLLTIYLDGFAYFQPITNEGKAH